MNWGLWGKQKDTLPKADTSEFIFFNDTGTAFLSTKCDQPLMERGIATIRELFRQYVEDEYQFANDEGLIPFEKTLMFYLYSLDKKRLGHEEYREILERMFPDNDNSKSGSRFFDTILLIEMTVATEVLDALKARFIRGVVYNIPRSLDNYSLPSKEDWMGLLSEAPYVYLLPFFDMEFYNFISKRKLEGRQLISLASARV